MDTRDIDPRAFTDARRQKRADPTWTRIPGVDGFVTTFNNADGDKKYQEAVGCIFDQQRLICANITYPMPGVDSASLVVKMVKAAYAALNKPLAAK